MCALFSLFREVLYWEKHLKLSSFEFHGTKSIRPVLVDVWFYYLPLTKASDSIHRGKMEQILLAYSLPKETVIAIMMLFWNTKVKVRSSDGDTDYFDIVASLLQGDTLAQYLYVFRTSIDKIKENGFKLTKEISRKYHEKQLPTLTTPMLYRFWQMHPPKPKPCYIVWNEPLQALASMSMHTRQSICALINQVTSLH